jgi:beta-lactamase class D
MAIARKLMMVEQTDTYTIRAKTGWTRDDDTHTGWWVGYVETDNGVFFFTTRIQQPRHQDSTAFGACRKSITKAILRDLQIIP